MDGSSLQPLVAVDNNVPCSRLLDMVDLLVLIHCRTMGMTRYNELKNNLGVGNSPGNGNTRLGSAKASQGSSKSLVGSRVGGTGHDVSLDRQDV